MSIIKNKKGYIDPGTGGYLVSSIWPTIITFLTIALATVGAFFSRYLIQPLKKLFQNKKVLLSTIILIICIFTIISTAYIINKNKSNFDPTLTGSHFYSENEIYPGYILYEGGLYDRKGNEIHNWTSQHLGIIQKDGTYLAQLSYEQPLFGKYHFNGTPIWEKTEPVIHHEISITPENNILTLSKEMQVYNGRNVEFGVILEYTQEGELISKWSTWENLEYLKQFHDKLSLELPANVKIPEEHRKNTSIWGGNYDYYHINSIRTLPQNENSNFEMDVNGKKVKPFQEGNWIFSFRHGSMIFILDKDTKQVVWRVTQFDIEDEIQGPHDPTMLPNGNIRIFDNGRYREWSRIIEIDPFNLEILWEYKTKEFFTLTRGDAQKLPNGNLLLVESDSGRIFEINEKKEVVWEYYRPDRWEKGMPGSTDEDIGKRIPIHHITLYEKEFIENLLEENA